MDSRCAWIFGVSTLEKSKRWHLEMIVFSSFWGSVVARIKMTCSGGSSSVFNSALAALEESWCTSSMI